MKKEKKEQVFALCVENKDCDDLEKRKVYLIVAKKLYEKGRWVCWKAFTAAPLNVLLLRFQAYPRGHLR
jgi:hypothetical protein